MPSYDAPNRPKFPWARSPHFEVDVTPNPYPSVPYPGDPEAGNGASRGENMSPTTSASTNVPMPSNKGPRTNGGGDHGKGVL